MYFSSTQFGNPPHLSPHFSSLFPFYIFLLFFVCIQFSVWILLHVSSLLSSLVFLLPPPASLPYFACVLFFLYSAWNPSLASPIYFPFTLSRAKSFSVNSISPLSLLAHYPLTLEKFHHESDVKISQFRVQGRLGWPCSARHMKSHRV